jgi:hypothetical protein
MTRYHFLLTAFCTAGISFIAFQGFTRPTITTDEAGTFQWKSPITPSERQAELVRSMGGKEAWDIVSTAEKVQAYRIEPPNSDWEPDTNNYVVTAGPIDIPVDVQADLSRLLTTHESMYWPDGQIGCLPVYGVRLKFQSARGEVDVNICFSCSYLEFAHNGKDTGGVLMGSVASKLAAVAKALFPDDEKIQKIH